MFQASALSREEVRHMGRSGGDGSQMASGGRAGDRTLQLSLIALSEIIQVDAKIAPARPLGRDAES